MIKDTAEFRAREKIRAFLTAKLLPYNIKMAIVNFRKRVVTIQSNMKRHIEVRK